MMNNSLAQNATNNLRQLRTISDTLHRRHLNPLEHALLQEYDDCLKTLEHDDSGIISLSLDECVPLFNKINLILMTPLFAPLNKESIPKRYNTPKTPKRLS